MYCRKKREGGGEEEEEEEEEEGGGGGEEEEEEEGGGEDDEEEEEESKNAATMKECHSHTSLPQYVNHTFVSEAHLGCHGYHCRCVLCEERTEAEETVEHRA